MSETILLYTSNELGSQPSLSFQYPVDAYGQQIQMAAMQNIGMKYDPHYSLFLAGPNFNTTKIKSKYTLRSLGAKDGMTLYIALVDPITGQPVQNPTQPSTRPSLSFSPEHQPILPRLDNKPKVIAKLPSLPNVNHNLPTLPMPQNKTSQHSSRPPPSLLSMAKQKQNGSPSKDQISSNGSNFTPLRGSPSQSSDFTPGSGRSKFPPLAPNSERVNPSPRYIDTAKTNYSSYSERQPVPAELYPYLCSMLDFEISMTHGSILMVLEKSTGIPYVIKKLSGQINPDTFYKEFMNVFNAENGAILHIHGFIPSPFGIVYENQPNGTLDDILESERISNAPSSWNATAKNIVLFGIAEGMRQLHSKRIMHRNLKPSNIILDNNYYPYIADVGFTREYCRNPSYMAPEMLAGNAYKSKVDIYSYGIIVYQVLSMHPPFDSTKSFSQIKQMVVDGVRPEIPSSIPESFANLIKVCWNQDSTSRTTFSKIVNGFIKGVFVLPDADKAFLLRYQRTVAPQYEPKEFCMAARIKTESDQGNIESTYDFAKCLLQGKGLIKNIHEGRKYLKIAADKGFPQAQYEHARYLMRFEKDDDQAIEYMKKAAANNNRYAQKFLSNHSKSPRRVLEQQACEGDPDAMYELGEQMEKTSPCESLEYFKMSADLGNVKAQLRVALSYHNGLNGAPKDIKEANKYYRMAALQGNAKALCNLAFNMQRGEGIEKDVKTANDLYRKSADSGYSIAQYNYAYNLMNGIGVNKNLEEATKLYKLAADQGHPGAQFSYASNLMKGCGIEKDVKTANEYFLKAAEKGNALAQCQLAMNYANGLGFEQNMETANKYYKMSADQGNARAQCNLAFSLQKGTGIDQDLMLANKYYKLSADQKYPIAQYNYAFNLENGIGIDKNLEEANKYYKLAADQGNANAQYSYGMNLMKGNGIAKDITAANKYLKMSMEQDNIRAQYQYAINLFKGNGVTKDPVKANELLRISADAGNVNAQFYLGYNLFNGLGIEKNPVEANKYYKMAADQGNANSQCNLACSYLNGIGTNKDIRLANKYYKLSADANNAVAMYNYGMHLLNGVGLDKNPIKGAEYLKKAVDAGNSSAMYCLAICYENGNGVEKDKKKFAELIQKSAEAGNKLANQRLKKIK
ncbi:hypothetical protein TRFO_30839 [Tritrichomonas foetus]|uniref:Protein kinase domain-containing protein n=1 Tax=Tritrichomonas foetus TaxID=1144522 RepID=A0A1J4JXB0_9EUKA|nr:hypothetical protein TRFO_30839 [Tritrichomonas foetus]|eukprot:OHT02174.1 hypothetical protein TRFO_30839 [Tritrichomonas foetus]